MKQESEAKIAWILYNLLEEANDHLYNRYEKEFMRFIEEEEKEEIWAAERLSERDPDSPNQSDF